MTEQYVAFLAYCSIPKSVKLKEIADGTNNDPELRGLRAAIPLNLWDSNSVLPYRAYKEELTIREQIVIIHGHE